MKSNFNSNNNISDKDIICPNSKIKSNNKNILQKEVDIPTLITILFIIFYIIIFLLVNSFSNLGDSLNGNITQSQFKNFVNNSIIAFDCSLIFFIPNFIYIIIKKRKTFIMIDLFILLMNILFIIIKNFL